LTLHRASVGLTLSLLQTFVRAWCVGGKSKTEHRRGAAGGRRTDHDRHLPNNGRQLFRNGSGARRQIDQSEGPVPGGVVHEPLVCPEHDAQFQRGTGNDRKSIAADLQRTRNHDQLHAFDLAYAAPAKTLAGVQTIRLRVRQMSRPRS